MNTAPTRTYGYVRVSTVRQITDRQVDTLHAHGVDKIVQDKISGARYDRPGLNAILDEARPGDTVVVSDFTRLGRNLYESMATAKKLDQGGIVLKSLKEGIDYSTSHGRLVAHIFGALAEHEREQILERTAEARAAAKARGKQTGRPKALTDDQARQFRALHDGGESIADLCRSFKISRATAYRVLEKGTVSA